MKSFLSQIESFRFQRVISLILEYYHRNKKTLIISSIALYLFLFCSLLLFKRYGESGKERDIFQYVMQIGCMSLISSILSVHYFSTLRLKPGSISALSLPCNPIERLLAALLVTSIAFALIYFFIYSVAFFSTFPFFRSYHLPFFNFDPLGIGWFSIIGPIISTPTLFLWGGLFFKRSPWIKTVLATIIYSVVCIAIITAIFYLIDPSWDAFKEVFKPKESEYLNGKLASISNSPIYFLWSLLLMTCIVLASYHLLKEKEVK